MKHKTESSALVVSDDECDVCAGGTHNGVRFDACDFIMRFETGDMDDEEVSSGFQHLIDSGIVWSLQGNYQRTARRLVELGECHA
jgi:hypothetical protein